MGFIKKIGSIYTTVILSVLLMALLIISTTLESLHGTTFAQKVFYQSRWFDLVLSALWLNIFCATILRFPFKKTQIGFLITHIGILGFLLGALLSRMFGVEGQMVLYEGSQSNMIKQPGYELGVMFPNQQQETFALGKADYNVVLTEDRLRAAKDFCPLEPKKTTKTHLSPKNGKQVDFAVVKIFEHAGEFRVIKPGSDLSPVNHALKVTLSSATMGIDQSDWLLEHDHGGQQAQAVMLGPVQLAIEKKKEVTQPKGNVFYVIGASSQELAAIDLDKEIPTEIALKDSDLSISNFYYYPYAAVGKENKLENFPQGRNLNPAVEFDIVSPNGPRAHYINFAFFPDYGSMHAKKSAADVGLTFKFQTEAQPEVTPSFSGPILTFRFSQDDAWEYEVKLKDQVLAQGDVVVGKEMPLGWMDLAFEVKEALKQAKVSYAIDEDASKKGPMAAAVVLKGSGSQEEQWVIEGSPVKVPTPHGDLYFSLLPIQVEVPFSLTLKSFKKIDYPGTRNPAAFESVVVLEDPKDHFTMQRTISMNHPLVYKGFKVFQSSYIQDAKRNASVFTVAKNPGIFLIYLSSVFILIGAMMQFFVKRPA